MRFLAFTFLNQTASVPPIDKPIERAHDSTEFHFRDCHIPNCDFASNVTVVGAYGRCTS